MTTRIIPVTPVDATAHVYRVTSGEIVRVFVQDRTGLGQVESRAHADGRGFTLAKAPTGQVWAEVKSTVVGLGSLGALSGLDLSACGIQVGRLAHGVNYWPPLDGADQVPSDGEPMQMLIDGVKAIRIELSKLVAGQTAIAASTVSAYK